MRQSAEIASQVLSGLVHTVRVSLYRKGVPYPGLHRTGTVRFKLDQPWPQPSPISPKMPYAVLHIAEDEIDEFLAKIVSRFQRQVTFSWLAATRYLKKKPHLDCPDDATFGRYMTQSVYAYFMTDKLDDADRALLEKNGLSAASVHKNDLAPLSLIEAFDGLHVTGSAAYWRETSRGTFEPLGIAMVDNEFKPGELIRPSDGNAWKRAKMHVLQGATYLSLFVTHPKCHFPIDAIIAVTRSALPKDHTLAKLLEPHFYQQLPLDYSVLHVKNGPGYNDPRLYYTAFSGKGASQYRLFEVHHGGLAGHDAFPAHRFGALLDARKTEYTDYLRGFHEVILAFVRKVVANVEIDDVVRQWLEHCANYTRGFGRAETMDKEQLAHHVATIIWNCSVVHSADHWEFFQIPMEHKPTRLRVAAPFDRSECTFAVNELTEVEDRLRHYMWHELYVRPFPLKKLCELDYGFADASLQKENRAFLADVATYANRFAGKYVPLEQICTSIQY